MEGVLMGRRTVFLAAAVLAGLFCAQARADSSQTPISFAFEPDPNPVLQAAPADPLLLSTTPADDEGVYQMPAPPTPENGSNLGGVNFSLSVAYFNHYIYRGVDHSIGAVSSGITNLKASTLNLQATTELDFNFGRYPHPFVGLFADVYDADPLSRFQEVRPYFGLEWTVKPFTLRTGDNTYIYPDRENLNTAEIFTQITFDDALLFHREKPLLSPYIYGAYDYDKNHGWYTEAGVMHAFEFEDLGLTITLHGDVAYILGYQQQFVFINSLHDTGWQHYDGGVIVDYSINRFLNLTNRFGQIDVLGYITYTGKMDGDITANNDLWGGVGISFKY
jgi:hypothetical protein